MNVQRPGAVLSSEAREAGYNILEELFYTLVQPTRRYRLPEPQARLYAGFLGLPVEARHD